MKVSKSVIVVILAAFLAIMPASAQFRFGIKAGVNVSSLHFNNTVLDDLKNSDNRTGFTGGLMCEFTVPIIGLGFDLSAMYTHRVNDVQTAAVAKYSNDYIEIPINLKYKLGLPVIGKIITPYFFTGPSFAFLTSKKRIENAFQNKATDVTWNLGAGLQLLNHLQIGANYGWGINKAVEYIGTSAGETAKINGWTVTAAYLF